MLAHLISRIRGARLEDVAAAANDTLARVPPGWLPGLDGASAAFLLRVLDWIDTPLCFFDHGLTVRLANQAYCQLLQMPRDAVINHCLEELTGIHNLQSMRPWVERALGGERLGFDASMDGAGVIRIEFLPQQDERGAIDGVLAIVRADSAVLPLQLAPPQVLRSDVMERERKQRELMQSLSLPTAFIGSDGRFKWANQAFCDEKGLSEAKLLDAESGSATTAAVSALIQPELGLAQTGHRQSVEKLRELPNGEQRWCRIDMVPGYGRDGALSGVYVTFADIHDVRLANQSLARQREWTEAFNENFPQALAYIDTDGVHRFANRAYCNLVHLPRERIIGQRAGSFLDEKSARTIDIDFRKALEGARARSEHHLSREDVSGWIAIDWLPDHDDNGAVRGIYIVCQDVSDAKETRQAYEESVRELQRAMDSVALPISFVDTGERIRFVNQSAVTWMRRPAAELVGMSTHDMLSAENYAFARPFIERALAGEAVQYERQLSDPHGLKRWALVRYVPTRDETGKVTGFYTTATDIENLKQQEMALQQANELLNAHFENTPLASIMLDPEGRITRWSSQAETLFGWRRDEAQGSNVASLGLLAAGDGDDALVALDVFLDAGQGESELSTGTVQTPLTQPTTRFQVRETRRRDGTNLTCEWHLAVLRDATGKVSSTLALIQDVTARVETERRLKEVAQFDALTRLLNRHALEPTLRDYIREAQREHIGVAVLFIDLDHFKNINDTLGHRVGDLMLIEVANVLRRCMGADGQVARIGGDEFMVILRHLRPKSAAHETANRILKAIAEPILVQSQRLSVAASIGIAVYPDHGRTPETLLRSADQAMYKAKEGGKNRVEFYSAALALRHERRKIVQNALRSALQNDTLRLYFQPRVDVHDGHVIGSEALLRWTDAALGVISPKEFIGIAEESGLIHELGLMVFRKAAWQIRDWQDRGIPFGILSVNFSAHQLLVASFIDEVDRVLEETGCDPRSIEVEITETSMLFDLEVTRNVIADLKHRGMRIAIDDFGTGFSSLSHLQQLDIDTLKIDQSFIRDMLHDAGDLAITRSVISLGKGLGVSVTAEGVENDRQLAALREAGCDHYQGFYFSPAVAREDLEVLLGEA